MRAAYVDKNSDVNEVSLMNDRWCASLNCTKPGPPLLRVDYFMAVPKIFMVNFFVFRAVGRIVQVRFCGVHVFPLAFRRIRFAAAARRWKVRLCRDFSNIDFVYNGCNYFTVGADVTRTRSSSRSRVATAPAATASDVVQFTRPDF